MANEINVQAQLTLQRAAANLVAAANVTLTQVGSKEITAAQLTTSGTTASIQIDGTANFRFIFAKNLDAAAYDVTKYIQISTDSGSTNPVARLYPGECCMLRVNPQATLYYKAFGTSYTPNLFFFGLEA